MPIYVDWDSKAIKGGVTAKGFEDMIEASSFQWGIGRGVSTPVGSATDREASAPSVSEVTLTKLLDAASPKLLEDGLRGEFGAKVIVHFVRTEKNALVDFLQLTLTNAGVSGYSFSSGGDRPSESVSINFTKVEFSNTPAGADTKADAKMVISYDLAQATGS
jgi:type VI secretion system secreted protein Hcp